MRKYLYVLLCLSFSFSAFSQTNSALNFNGSSSYVDLGNSSLLKPSSALTEEIWVKSADWNVPAEQELISCFELGGYGMFLSGGQLWVHIWPTGASGYRGVSYPVSNLTNNAWHHLAATFDGRYIRLYVNAVLVGTDDLATAGNTVYYKYPGNNFLIGADAGQAATPQGFYFNGPIDEVRIWNVALSQSQLKQNMLKGPASNASGLVAYYTFNNGSGTTLTNVCTNTSLGNGVVNGATWTASPVQFNGNALNFDGTDDYIPILKPLPAGSSYTKEAWVYATKSTLGPCNVLSSAGSPLWVDGNRLRAGNNGPAADVIDGTNFPTNTWVHVAVTYDGATGAMNLYRNGTLVASGTATKSYAGEDNYIGAWYNPATPATESYWGGNIDEVRIWNTVRTQAQIQANMWNELNPANPAQTSGLVAYYTFNQGLASGANAGLATVLDQKASFNGTLKNFSLSGSTSNYVGQQNGLFVLPVKWLAFTARMQEGKALLEWQTAEEGAGLAYTVQRSTNGRLWTNAGLVPVAGNSGSNTYRFTDNGLQQGPNHYRIALQGKDGQISYSDTRSLNLAVESPGFKLLDNSVHSSLRVDVLKPCVLSLYNQGGKQVLQQTVKQGLQVIDVGGFARGIYFLSNGKQTEKFLLQ